MTQDLSWRNDVINKSILRCIKRFYLREFRKRNQNIVKKRYAQFSSSIIFRAIKSMIKDLLGDIENLAEISQLVMIIIAIKPANRYPFIKDIYEKGNKIVGWMYQYSNSKFEQIVSIPELKIIWDFVLENHQDQMFKDWSKAISKNSEVYKEAVKEFALKFHD